ncbi:type IX secretion system membrane protein PorP/SprF [Pontibacter sp. JH31]|uniref:Type IX secretion system membrane protein PorP/SprF n=1 Tax=Pontibacter aquaedesilientis TaxID=2766980 RepID=A0ABR7XHA6_9BACT|nr:type IX secretion system membrane protein PorP/SprF [Pontibacter aquaedesilientis]MBD1397336.1 type IX secretion system membrane protein PorP/SprF [Pontibacter aquaedesilientis]
MKKLPFLLVAFIGVVVQAFAQQRPQYSQYMVNNFLLNPALTGIEDYADIRVSTRQQWVGLDGAPVTYYATAHMPLNKGAASTKYAKALAHHGAGIIFHTDKTGPLRRTGLSGTYAYHLPLTRTINASAGVAAGIIRNSVNSSDLQFTNPSDPLVGGGAINQNVLDLTLGFWVYSRNFSVGISGAQLLKNAGTFRSSENNNVTLDLQRHYFVTGSYRFSPFGSIDFIPSVMLKLADPSPLAIDFNLRALYDERFWVGASYRHDDALVGMVGVYVSPLLDISYSYDATTSNLNRVSAGTHEVVVGFKLLNDRRIICPQWVW